MILKYLLINIKNKTKISKLTNIKHILKEKNNLKTNYKTI